MLASLPWWLFAIVFSIGFAAFMLLNQQMKLRADLMIAWRGIILTLLFTPLGFFLDLPQAPGYYLAVIAVGFAACFTDMRVLRATAEVGGGPVSRLMPISVWVSFGLWTAIDGAYRERLVATPAQTAGVLGCLILCVLAVSMLRKDKVSQQALPLIIPIIIGGAIIDNLNKFAMSFAAPDQLLDAALGYIWLQNITIALIMGGRMVFDRGWVWREDMFARRLLIGSAMLAFIIGSITVVRNFAMAGAPNPGYVGAIGLGATVLVILFNRWQKVTDDSKIWAGLAFVASAVMLVILTSS